MGFSSLIHTQIAAAKKMLEAGGLLASIKHEAATGVDDYGNVRYAAPATIRAAVEYKQSQRVRMDGSILTSKAKVTILEPLAIGPADRITLPDGSTPPLIDVEYMKDSAGLAYSVTLYFGPARSAGMAP